MYSWRWSTRISCLVIFLYFFLSERNITLLGLSVFQELSKESFSVVRVWLLLTNGDFWGSVVSCTGLVPCSMNFKMVMTSCVSSSHRSANTDILDPLSSLFFIVHCFRQVFRVTYRIGTELLYVGPSWSSCLFSSMWWGPREYITYEFVLTCPAVSCLVGSSNLDSFPDGW